MLKTFLRKKTYQLQSFLNRKYPHQALKSFPAVFYFKTRGYCPCCEKEVDFYSKNSMLRETFECSNCRSVPRERLLMEVINELTPDWRNMRIHESSPAERGVSVRLKKECKYYTSSQYYPNEALGKVIKGFRNEDIEKQTFADQAFDLVITQDVMEHVFDPAKAFREIKRTLSPGGMHIFTTPLNNKFEPSIRWSELDSNGKIVWLYEPEYHGNPVDESGSPVTMHWGYDIVDFIQEHANMKTHIICRDDLSKGIRGNGLEVIVSAKE